MIEDFQLALSAAWELLGMEFTLYGYVLSFRQVMLWSIVASLLLWFIGRLFLDG